MRCQKKWHHPVYKSVPARNVYLIDLKRFIKYETMNRTDIVSLFILSVENTHYANVLYRLRGKTLDVNSQAKTVLAVHLLHMYEGITGKRN